MRAWSAYDHLRDLAGMSEDELSDDEIDRRLNAPVPLKYREYSSRGEWWTAEQAAEAFNLTVREIEERYRPLLPSTAVLEPYKEYEYLYDFEVPGFTFNNYRARGSNSSDPFKRGFSMNPDRRGSSPTDEDPIVFGTIEQRGYDFGLEPKHRRLVRVQPRLYLKSALYDARWERVQSRKVKPLPPRGKSGRFTKSVE